MAAASPFSLPSISLPPKTQAELYAIYQDVVANFADPNLAVENFFKLYCLVNDYNYAEANFYLAYCYRFGYGTIQNQIKGAECFVAYIKHRNESKVDVEKQKSVTETDMFYQRVQKEKPDFKIPKPDRNRAVIQLQMDIDKFLQGKNEFALLKIAESIFELEIADARSHKTIFQRSQDLFMQLNSAVISGDSAKAAQLKEELDALYRFAMQVLPNYEITQNIAAIFFANCYCDLASLACDTLGIKTAGKIDPKLVVDLNCFIGGIYGDLFSAIIAGSIFGSKLRYGDILKTLLKAANDPSTREQALTLILLSQFELTGLAYENLYFKFNYRDKYRDKIDFRHLKLNKVDDTIVPAIIGTNLFCDQALCFEFLHLVQLSGCNTFDLSQITNPRILIYDSSLKDAKALRCLSSEEYVLYRKIIAVNIGAWYERRAVIGGAGDFFALILDDMLIRDPKVCNGICLWLERLLPVILATKPDLALDIFKNAFRIQFRKVMDIDLPPEFNDAQNLVDLNAALEKFLMKNETKSRLNSGLFGNNAFKLANILRANYLRNILLYCKEHRVDGLPAFAEVPIQDTYYLSAFIACSYTGKQSEIISGMKLLEKQEKIARSDHSRSDHCGAAEPVSRC